MFKSQFGSAFMRLFALVAFALCFTGLAHAQQPTKPTLSLIADPPVNEGAPATFRATLSSPASQRLTFRFTTFAGAGATGAREVPEGPFDADYDGFSTNGSYTFEQGATVVRIQVPTFEDNSYEVDELFNAFISSPTFGGRDASAFLNLGQTQAIGTILNTDGPPEISLVQPGPIFEGDVSNRARQNYNFTVNVGSTLTSPDQETLGRDITLAFSTVDGTATSIGNNAGDRDFVPVNFDVVTVPAGTRQFQYTVVVLGDDVYERDEGFTLNVQYSPPLANTRPASTTGAIRDNDLPTYSISSADPDARTIVEEGNPLIFIIVLRDRQGQEVPALENITFDYAVQNVTATQGTDFTDPNNGSFTIPAGDSRFTLRFPTIDDNAIEQSETFRFIVRSAVGTIEPEGTGSNVGVGTILDTADNNAGTILTIQDATVVEGNGGTNEIAFTVNLSRATSQSVSVSYQTAASNDPDPAARATSGTDFTPVTGRLTFAPGETTRTFTVPVTTDLINELDENFRVRLFNPTNAAFANNVEAIFAKGTILDDDSAGVITVARADVDVAENVNSRFVEILVNFTPSTTQKRPVTVDFTTVPDTAQQAGQRDYFGKSGTLTFRPGPSGARVQQAIRIEIVNDNIREGNESFNVRLSNAKGATLGAQSDTRVTILDDDPLPSVSVRPVAPVNEGAGVVNIAVVISGKSQTPITVNYSFVDGTAVNGQDQDYQAQNGSVTFAPDGPTVILVPVTITDDNISEGNETFSFVLNKTPQDNSFALPPRTATAVVTIVDNERLPAITIADSQVVEGSTGGADAGNDLVFPVTLSIPSSRPVKFFYTTLINRRTDCAPVNGCDFAGPDDFVIVRDVPFTIPAGATKAEIRVRLLPDTLNEFDEQFTLATRSLSNALPSSYRDPKINVRRSGALAFGTILNDDVGGNISISGPTNTAGQNITNITEGYNRGGAIRVGEIANFVVTLPAPTGRALTVNYSFGGTADAFDVQDLTSGPGRGQIKFFKGMTTKTISVRARMDRLAEGPERLNIALSIKDNNGVNSYTANGSNANVTIDDRTPQVDNFTPNIGFPAYGTITATRVTINGLLLRTDGNQRVSAVLFNNVAATGTSIEYLSDNSIAVAVPDNAKTGPISLRLVDGSIISTVGRTSNNPTRPSATIPDFIVQPVITSFTPTSAVAGSSTVVITGRNFQDGNNPVRAIAFSDGTRAFVGQNVTVVSDTRIDLLLPAGTVNGPLSVVTSRGGVGPASQDNLAIVNATAGNIVLGENPDRNAILEGSVGTFAQPVRNFNGTGDDSFHRPYQFFLAPARQNGGNGDGNAFTVTPLTVRFQITSSTGGGRVPAIAVSADLTGSGQPRVLNAKSNADGFIDVAVDGRFNATTPFEVAIVDAGTDDLPPIVGGTPAKVTVTARIVQSSSPGFFPITPANQVPTVQVDRIEPFDSVNQTAIAFGPNTRASFSVPFALGSSNSVPLTSVFNTAPVVNGVRRYTVLRLNVVGQGNQIENREGNEGADFIAVPDNGLLERGIGYRLVVADNATVQLKTRGNGLVTPAGSEFSYNLTRNVAFASSTNNQGNATNGYNFIGFPFSPTQFKSVDFNQGDVTFNGIVRTVPEAAAAGLINAQLFELNGSGALVPANTTTLEPFKAYFVQVFRDNITLTLKNPTK